VLQIAPAATGAHDRARWLDARRRRLAHLDDPSAREVAALVDQLGRDDLIVEGALDEHDPAGFLACHGVAALGHAGRPELHDRHRVHGNVAP